MISARTAPCETLVHISASSGASDDADYRAHAAACLDFQPVSRLSLASDLDDAGPFVSRGPDTTHDDRGRPLMTEGSDTGLGRQLAEARNYTGARETASYHAQRRHAGLEPGCNAENGWPYKISLATPTGDQSLVDYAHHLHDADNGGDPEHDSSSFQTPPSTVPNSQPILTQEWEVEKDSSPNDGRIKVVQPHVVQDSSSQALPGSSPFREPQVQAPIDAVAEPQTSSQAGSSHLLSRLPLEIHPPPPVPSSTAEFTTHTTPTLRMLSEQMNLTRLFRPAHESRPLRTLERGYWFLRLSIDITSHTDGDSAISEDEPRSSLSMHHHNPSTWSVEHFTQFWNYLSTFIGQEGRAGWGVWAICETSPAEPSSHHDSTNATANASDGNNSLTVKVFTWGETAPHIYLLLYLASERRIKHVKGVEWRDGGENTVIRMR